MTMLYKGILSEMLVPSVSASAVEPSPTPPNCPANVVTRRAAFAFRINADSTAAASLQNGRQVRQHPETL